MRLAGELTQHLTCMIGRIGLAEDLAIEHDHRVGTDHEAQPHRILREHLLNETEENGGDGNVSIGFRTFTETSEVTFKELTEEDINAYVATGETIDKAGAYGIQGKGAVLVEGYEGDYNNIVGLPVDKLLENFPDLLRREVPVEITQKEA